ncbi:phosphatidylinositol-specific phospholipase C domain-containing protein [Streptomyces zagrosensis]|uniref:1-phosphatidylinositol phosphodiesterase n=1 Tax=Streptomyces zagrosensis TaxID=1042984 RepID=A0A7W9Q5E9_9ACTN|nr:phosphatidylinositol-specific phospholipase C domain-containing protein [Streptomyces zagrosensis]MBB5933699.1 hypothetical protein [Streptomyces zagrosensis]
MTRTIARADGVRPPRRSRRLAVLVSAACLALSATLLSPATAGAAGSTNEDAFKNLGQADRAEWMWGIASDTKLSNMSIPGTHDTLAIHGGSWVQTQEDWGDSADTLTAQLDRGIRAIDIRARVSGNASFTIHHGAYYQNANFDDVLSKAQSFLRAHPTESIIMRLKAECPYTGVDAPECANDPKSVTPEKVRAIFGDYVRKYPGLFYTASVSGAGRASVPTLGQVRGKVVLGSFDSAETDDYGLKGFNDRQEDNWAPGSIGEKWGDVKDNVDKAIAGSPNDLYVTYSSGSKFPNLFPSLLAGGWWENRNGVNTQVPGVNYHLMKHLNTSAGRVGIIMTDFPGWGLVNAIIDHNGDNEVKGGQRSIWLVNPDKTYNNSQYQDRCMVRGPEFDSSKNGGLVTQRACQSSPPSSHQWVATKPDTFDGKGHFWIKASNGKCLTMPYNDGVTPKAGTQLFWWPCETRWFSGSQMWEVMPTKLATANGSRPAYWFRNNWTNLCLSMDPATASKSGGKVTQDVCPR